jgi:basic membrane protein A and related proteins
MRIAACLSVLAIALAGCGGGSDDASTTAAETTAATTGATPAPAGPSIRVGLVTDVGGLDDRSFNFLANQGLERAHEQLGVQVRVVVSRSNADYVPNLSKLAR